MLKHLCARPCVCVCSSVSAGRAHATLLKKYVLLKPENYMDASSLSLCKAGILNRECRSVAVSLISLEGLWSP